jgi:two-component system sensor histidine kinase SenX3
VAEPLRTIDGVDPTSQALLAALVVALVAGGGVLVWRASKGGTRARTRAGDSAVPEGVASVLSVLRSSAVVVGSDDTVVTASAPAYSLGLVSGSSLLSDELAELVSKVRRDGQIRETELQIARTAAAARHLTVRCAPLSSTLVLALVEDRTRERRVEAVRRDFVANVSHELKTPVGAIQLLAEAVSDAADDPVAAPVVVAVDDVVAAAVDATAIDADARGIKVLTGGVQGLKVFGNDAQVRAAVANLVANAVAYSGDDSTVLVSTKADEGMVTISIIDQGIGIPSGELDRIFERFYRVDPARHRSTGGTGLGLSIVKHVAATHGGDIQVWSVEGQGSTFTLTLPRAHQRERS